ncbi:MAG: hypothetical protein AVDCRST_MAG59-4042, partial [uncultured Thermomicrobiales bacterium]
APGATGRGRAEPESFQPDSGAAAVPSLGRRGAGVAAPAAPLRRTWKAATRSNEADSPPRARHDSVPRL